MEREEDVISARRIDGDIRVTCHGENAILAGIPLQLEGLIFQVQAYASEDCGHGQQRCMDPHNPLQMHISGGSMFGRCAVYDQPMERSGRGGCVMEP